MDLTFRLQLATAVLAGLALGGILLATQRAGRASVRNALVLLLTCAGAELLAASPFAPDYPRLARIALNFASFGAGVALIRLALLTLYRLLAALRVRVVSLAEDLVTAAVLLLWIFVWLRLAGVDLASLVATSAVITAVIAFAMQDTLGNILGGIVLQLDDSMRVGDWVQVDDIRGRVTDVRWRYTAIETRNRETVFVPNSALMKNRFTVIGSRNDPELRWRRWVWFAVELGAPPSRVRDALERAVTDADIPCVSRDPKPDAILMDVTDGCARYALRYWLRDPHEDDATDSRVRAHALAALERAGIHLASRREERLVFAEDEARRAALAAAEIARRMNALQSVPLFGSLSDDERSQVAQHLVHAPFLAGDVVTRQGAVAHWLYLVIEGTAEICDETGGTRRYVSSLGPGDIFGERGMLTGEPRSSTVIATTDLECYRLDKAGLAGVLRERPDIAEHMSSILAQRVAELDRLRASAAGPHATASVRTDMLARIRAFFGLD
jgi:small-conductance mechanosensitive channel/CRP-like cAMP-binding protein